MHRFIRIIFIISVVGVVAGCKQEETGNQLLGSWTTPLEQIEFKKDGTYLVRNRNGDFEGKYSFAQNGSILVFSPAENLSTTRIESRYGLLDNGSKLLIERSFSGTLVFVRQS